MKSMNYILSIILLLLSFVSNAQISYNWGYYNPNTGQYEYITSTYDPDIEYTPNNSQVSVGKWKNTD